MTEKDMLLRGEARRVAAILGLRGEELGDPRDLGRAVDLLMLYHALLGILGTDELARSWMHGPNSAFRGEAPRSVLAGPRGLEELIAYVQEHLNRT